MHISCLVLFVPPVPSWEDTIYLFLILIKLSISCLPIMFAVGIPEITLIGRTVFPSISSFLWVFIHTFALDFGKFSQYPWRRAPELHPSFCQEDDCLIVGYYSRLAFLSPAVMVSLFFLCIVGSDLVILVKNPRWLLVCNWCFLWRCFQVSQN